jgi:hypothetical protein
VAASSIVRETAVGSLEDGADLLWNQSFGTVSSILFRFYAGLIVARAKVALQLGCYPNPSSQTDPPIAIAAVRWRTPLRLCRVFDLVSFVRSFALLRHNDL